MQHTYCRPYRPCLAALLIASENRVITVRYYFNTLPPPCQPSQQRKKNQKRKKFACHIACSQHSLLRVAPLLFLLSLICIDVSAPLVARIAPISYNPYAAPIPCLFPPILIPMCGEYAPLPLPVFRFFSYSLLHLQLHLIGDSRRCEHGSP